jgi:hypothetical protein
LIGRKIKVAVAAAIIVTIAVAVFTTWWVLTALAPIAFAAIYCSRRMMNKTLVQQRAIILAVEVLAVDFAGWGNLFPKARQRATAMFKRDAGDWPKLIDLYLPPERRTDAIYIQGFAPSEGSIASARAAT